MGTLNVGFMVNFYRIKVVGTSSASLPVGISVHRQLSTRSMQCSDCQATENKVWDY